MKPKAIAILCTVIVIAFFLFAKYGRAVYMPLIQKVKGKETVQSITDKIDEDVIDRLRPALDSIGLDTLPQKLYLLGLKQEQLLEVYAFVDDRYKLLKTYPFTAYSGNLGPKLREGDKQIPEGIYQVEYLNPNSAYYLSIKLNYPNQFDKAHSTLMETQEMGGDIFIHGKAATIGCIPIGDDAIEEVFFLVSHAGKHNVQVVLSPLDFRKHAQYPEIAHIDWEEELYDLIRKSIKKNLN